MGKKTLGHLLIRNTTKKYENRKTVDDHRWWNVHFRTDFILFN